ncbi:MAG: hypothetical protein KF819_26275 [Labilithrix sp.]|nr:hypothetical protein [Labilithrix sp.]
MSCEAFDDALMDALYEELDEASSEAASEHAASCASCADRLEKLRATREAALPSLLEPVPEGLEAKILAAADAAMKPATPAKEAEQAKEAKVIPLFARPQLMLAAGFLLVLGAGFAFMQMGARKSESLAQSAPAHDEEPTAAATASAALAMNEPSPVPPAAMPVAAATATVAASAAGGKAEKAAQDPELAAAKKLYDAGRYAEALPRFLALSPSHPEAELYVARCFVRTQGCSVAAPHFDAAATRNAGTETGSRASLEGARCYGSMGEAQAARSRYNALTEDAYVAPEARDELAGLDGDHPKKNSVKRAMPAPPVATAGTPVPAQHAAPKAVAKPKPAEAPAAVE